jgi:hypothetical protein
MRGRADVISSAAVIGGRDRRVQFLNDVVVYHLTFDTKPAKAYSNIGFVNVSMIWPQVRTVILS